MYVLADAVSYLSAALRKKGIPRDKVTVLNIPPGNLVSALQGGAVDTVAVGNPSDLWCTRQRLDEAAEIATRWVAGLDPAVARQAIRHMTFDPRITQHTVAAWEENVRVLLEQKKLKTALPWQQGLEFRFIA